MTLLFEVVVEAAAHERQDGAGVVTADRENEGEVELLHVGGVESHQLRVLFVAAGVQTRPPLLARRGLRQLQSLATPGPELGMGADQIQLILKGCLTDGRAHCLEQVQA